MAARRTSSGARRRAGRGLLGAAPGGGRTAGTCLLEVVGRASTTWTMRGQARARTDPRTSLGTPRSRPGPGMAGQPGSSRAHYDDRGQLDRLEARLLHADSRRCPPGGGVRRPTTSGTGPEAGAHVRRPAPETSVAAPSLDRKSSTMGTSRWGQRRARQDRPSTRGRGRSGSACRGCGRWSAGPAGRRRRPGSTSAGGAPEQPDARPTVIAASWCTYPQPGPVPFGLCRAGAATAGSSRALPPQMAGAVRREQAGSS